MSGDRARPALVAGERVLSWRAWERAAAALERAFDARSIAHGARIACIADTTPALAALLLACARSRRVIVPLNPRLGANDLGFALADADPALVLREDDPLFAAAFAGTDDAVPVSGDPDAGLAIVYTSGSTGRPRGVPLRQRHLVWNAHALAHALALTHDDVVLTAVPMSHIFGLSASTLSALVAGATNVLIPRFRAADVLDAIERERVSVLHGVPTMFALLVEEQRRAPRDLRTLRTGIMAGAPCPPALVADVETVLGFIPRVSYGLSEASPGVTMTYPDDSEFVRRATLGRALPGVDVRVAVDGELLVRGPNVFDGYRDGDRFDRDSFDADGFFATGDLVHADDDEVLTFVARKKELIVRGGYKIAPLEVEPLIAELPWASEVVLVGVPDAVLGERSIACIMARGDAPADPRGAVRDALRGRIADYKLPDEVAIVDAFPQTPSGKVQRHGVRALAIERFAGAAQC